jgi:hypothetical protein
VRYTQCRSICRTVALDSVIALPPWGSFPDPTPSDQKFGNDPVGAIDAVIVGNDPQDVTKQIIQMLFKSDVTHRCSRLRINRRERIAGHQGLAHGAVMECRAMLENELKRFHGKTIAELQSGMGIPVWLGEKRLDQFRVSVL